jgi:serralysin
LIENAVGGSGDDILRGNSIANKLRGSAGSDVLDGRAGNDVLVGGRGADAFLFRSALNASSNVDRVVDFDVREDTIRLDKAVFTAFTSAGALAGTAFRVGGAACDRTDRIVYDKLSGALTYDPDGTGAAAPIKFAQLAIGLRLGSADFVVV